MEQNLMRSARIKDVWRDALRNKSNTYSLDRIELKNIKGIGDRDVSFPRMITALCGENGVGKTTLLRTIFAALVPRRATALGIKLQPQNLAQAPTAICEISVRTTDENKKISWEKYSDAERVSKYFEDDDDEARVVYIDAAANAQRVIHSVGRDADFESVIDGAPELVDDSEIRALRSEITGRNYSEVRTFEIEEYGDIPVFPYFKVTVGSISYGSEEMGLGELCVNYLIWSLQRCQNGSLILLEEPESHLPPRAQERLMAHIAELSTIKRLSLIISTHSQHTLENIPNTHIAFLGRNNENFLLINNPKRSILYESLRIATSPLSLLVVEDHSAFALLKGMIEKCDSSLFDRIDFTWKKGYTDIDEILSKVPRQEHGRITVLGVYDGDQAKEKRPDGLNWPYLFLPGANDPIFYLVEAVRANPRRYGGLLSKDESQVELAIANLGTTDIKDFFIKLKKSIGGDIQVLYDVAAQLWLSVPANEELSKAFIASLKEKLFA